MSLFLLRARKDLPMDDNPWNPWYDKMVALVVRARDEAHARLIAQENAYDEKRGEFMGQPIAKTKQPWLDSKYTTCEKLLPRGEAGVLVADVREA